MLVINGYDYAQFLTTPISKILFQYSVSDIFEHKFYFIIFIIKKQMY